MKILIADDDSISRTKLRVMLQKRGYEVVEASDGTQAWGILTREDRPQLAILDWMMPGLDGVEICRRARADATLRSLFLILLTSRNCKENLLEGLRAGANDYMTKPFDPAELEARVQVAAQFLTMQLELAERVRELEEALTRVRLLQGLLPICSYCKKVRDDKNYWHQVEKYVAQHSHATFSHGICPDCFEDKVKPEIASYRASRPAPKAPLTCGS